MRTLLRVGLIGTTATILLGAMAGVSWADTASVSCFVGKDTNGLDCETWFKKDSGISVSHAVFTADGETLWVDDRYVDGRGVFLSASWGANGYAQISATGGAGDSEGKDLSITDGTTVHLKMCQTDNGSLLNCVYPNAIA
ncbi:MULTISPECIES: hypothetical protein [unclassified Streptomyces]|uniref:hypothetical protein n=1 Tax=unclassified Streptomyces TaxID=2593676 RepID=UPI0036DFC559